MSVSRRRPAAEAEPFFSWLFVKPSNDMRITPVAIECRFILPTDSQVVLRANDFRSWVVNWLWAFERPSRLNVSVGDI